MVFIVHFKSIIVPSVITEKKQILQNVCNLTYNINHKQLLIEELKQMTDDTSKELITPRSESS